MQTQVFSILLLLWICGSSSFGASSINNSSSTEDTLKLTTLNEQMRANYRDGNYDQGISTAQSMLLLSNTLISKKEYVSFARKQLVDAYRYLGLMIEHTDSFGLSPAYFVKAFQIASQDKLYKKQGAILGHTGMYYYNSGDYPTSLSYSMRELELGQKTGDKYRMASAYNRIGINYKRLMMHNEALENLFNSANLYIEGGDSADAANAWNNIGNVYYNIKDYKQAYHYYQKEKQIGLLLHDEELVADAMNCTAQLFNDVAFMPKDSLIYYFNFSSEFLVDFESDFLLDSAIHYFNFAISYYATNNKSYELSDCYIGLATTYTLQKKHQAAIHAYFKAYELAKFNGVLQKEMTSSQGLYVNYQNTKQFDSSLYWFEIYNLTQDSIYNDSKSREIGRLESRHEFEAKEAELLAAKNRDKAVADAQKSKQQMILIIVSIGLLLVLILLIFIFNRFQIIKKQKHEIEYHKLELELKQKEIVDSITYAQRLQHAILAPQDEIVKFFPRSFLLYKPKDIVAGDFYFFEKTDTHIFYAAADCTGHGVPGAMVSIVCSNALTRSIKEFGLTDPADILNKTRELVVQTFEKSGQDVKDGMDISFISKNINTHEIVWAGAHNALWIYTNGELQEVKPDKHPIGKSYHNDPFHSHKISLQKNDSLYLLTDGYADQFGGENLPGGKEGGKKFKASRLKELLAGMQSKSFTEQKEILEKTFENWRGNLEQLDDVCIIGIGG
ncbi:MAG: SpoIIE family protein phosphatase [Crocinitomicaceae bacterium]|nr:SpoIIE family protein phosphatase [Crocinitomicaceae bacterium]